MKAQIILEKINTLYKNISIDDNISSIERDLMLSYIRNLYETFLVEETPAQTTTKTSTRTSKPPKAVKIDPIPAPVVVEEVVAPIPPKAVVVEIPDSIKEYAIPAVEPVQIEAPAPKPIKEVPKPVVVEEEHHALFEQKEAKELSEKLSSMPVHDLKKAMGLNEKILTITELFGGDQKAFDAALTDLNQLSSFDEAKAYMSENLAAKFDWASTSKKKKAQVFIKLVRRRYKK